MLFKKKESDFTYWSGILKKEKVKSELVDKLIWYEKLSEKADDKAHYFNLILSELKKYRVKYEPHTED